MEEQEKRDHTSKSTSGRLTTRLLIDERESELISMIDSDEELGTVNEVVQPITKVTYKHPSLDDKMGMKRSADSDSRDSVSSSRGRVYPPNDSTSPILSDRRGKSKKSQEQDGSQSITSNQSQNSGSTITAYSLPTPDSDAWGKIKTEGKELKVRFVTIGESSSRTKIEGWYHLEPIENNGTESDEFGVDFSELSYAMKLRPVGGENQDIEMVMTRRVKRPTNDLPRSGVVHITYPFTGTAGDAAQEPTLHEMRRRTLSSKSLQKRPVRKSLVGRDAASNLGRVQSITEDSLEYDYDPDKLDQQLTDSPDMKTKLPSEKEIEEKIVRTLRKEFSDSVEQCTDKRKSRKRFTKYSIVNQQQPPKITPAEMRGKFEHFEGEGSEESAFCIISERQSSCQNIFISRENIFLKEPNLDVFQLTDNFLYPDIVSISKKRDSDSDIKAPNDLDREIEMIDGKRLNIPMVIHHIVPTNLQNKNVNVKNWKNYRSLSKVITKEEQKPNIINYDINTTMLETFKTHTTSNETKNKNEFTVQMNDARQKSQELEISYPDKVDIYQFNNWTYKVLKPSKEMFKLHGIHSQNNFIRCYFKCNDYIKEYLKKNVYTDGKYEFVTHKKCTWSVIFQCRSIIEQTPLLSDRKNTFNFILGLKTEFRPNNEKKEKNKLTFKKYIREERRKLPFYKKKSKSKYLNKYQDYVPLNKLNLTPFYGKNYSYNKKNTIKSISPLVKNNHGRLFPNSSAINIKASFHLYFIRAPLLPEKSNVLFHKKKRSQSMRNEPVKKSNDNNIKRNDQEEQKSRGRVPRKEGNGSPSAKKTPRKESPGSKKSTGRCCGGKSKDKDTKKVASQESNKSVKSKDSNKSSGGCCGGKSKDKDTKKVGSQESNKSVKSKDSNKSSGGCCGGKSKDKDTKQPIKGKDKVKKTPSKESTDSQKSSGGCCAGKSKPKKPPDGTLDECLPCYCDTRNFAPEDPNVTFGNFEVMQDPDAIKVRLFIDKDRSEFFVTYHNK